MKIRHFGRIDLRIGPEGVTIEALVDDDFSSAFRLIDAGSDEQEAQIVFDLMSGQEVNYGEAVQALYSTSQIFREYREEIEYEAQYEAYQHDYLMSKTDALRLVLPNYAHHSPRVGILGQAPDPLAQEGVASVW